MCTVYFKGNAVARRFGLYALDRRHVLPSLGRALEMSVSDFIADNPQLLIPQGHPIRHVLLVDC